jgi:hypothetical protein
MRDFIAASRADCTAGSSIATNAARMQTTTTSSIKVNPAGIGEGNWSFRSFMSRPFQKRNRMLPYPHATVFFQVPDFGRILRERAFWDIYYEHCSYFTRISLERLFGRCGFEVIETWTDYDDQYLMIEARLAAPQAIDTQEENTGDRMGVEIAEFARDCEERVGAWRKRLRELAAQGRRVVVWGAGSKAVSFLAAVDETGVVELAVDINPYKQGTYLAGGGQEIVAPGRLHDVRPHTVIIMNPIYLREVGEWLNQAGIAAEIVRA